MAILFGACGIVARGMRATLSTLRKTLTLVSLPRRKLVCSMVMIQCPLPPSLLRVDRVMNSARILEKWVQEMILKVLFGQLFQQKLWCIVWFVCFKRVDARVRKPRACIQFNGVIDGHF